MGFKFVNKMDISKEKRTIMRDHRDTTANFDSTKKQINDAKVNREKVCPFLLRVFVANSRHNYQDNYNEGKVPKYELQIYTWLDATLKELTYLIRQAKPESKLKATSFDFVRVFPALNDHRRSYQDQISPLRRLDYNYRDIGKTISGIKGVEDKKTLSECKFEIGDYLDVSITPPTATGERTTLHEEYNKNDRDHRLGDRQSHGSYKPSHNVNSRNNPRRLRTYEDNSYRDKSYRDRSPRYKGYKNQPQYG